MNGSLVFAACTGSILVLAACASSGGTSRSTAPSSTIPIASSQAVVTTVATPSRLATPATNPVERVGGTVQGVAGDTVTLREGGSFRLTPQTDIMRLAPSNAAALQAGRVVAITAKRQPDDSLLASMIVVIPTATGFTLGQHPLEGGDLMTNATIEKVEGNGFTVTFPGGGGQVTLAPDVQITMLATGTPADVGVGSIVSAAVNNGVAQSVFIQ